MKKFNVVDNREIKDISDWHETIVRTSVLTWEARSGYTDDWTPMAHILYPQGDSYKSMVIMTPYATEEEKTATVKTLAQLCQKVKAIAFAQAVESWMKEIHQDDPLAKDYMSGKLKPSQTKDRVELFQVLMETKHTVKAHSYRIVRPSRGKKPYLKKWDRPAGKMMGRMTHILAEDPEFPLN